MPPSEKKSARLPLIATGVVVALLILAAVLWALGGGLTDLDGSASWAAALGSENGMQRAAILLVGETTALAGAIYLVTLASSRAKGDDRTTVRIAMAGGLLLIIDGAILVAIGWVAAPYVGDSAMTTEHPFIKTLELLIFTRSHISLYAGGLIGFAAAWDALRSLKAKDLPRWAPIAALAAGILAVLGGALLLIGAGAALRSIGILGSVAWSGARSSLVSYRAATDGD